MARNAPGFALRCEAGPPRREVAPGDGSGGPLAGGPRHDTRAPGENAVVRPRTCGRLTGVTHASYSPALSSVSARRGEHRAREPVHRRRPGVRRRPRALETGSGRAPPRIAARRRRRAERSHPAGRNGACAARRHHPRRGGGRPWPEHRPWSQGRRGRAPRCDPHPGGRDVRPVDVHRQRLARRIPRLHLRPGHGAAPSAGRLDARALHPLHHGVAARRDALEGRSHDVELQQRPADGSASGPRALRAGRPWNAALGATALERRLRSPGGPELRGSLRRPGLHGGVRRLRGDGWDERRRPGLLGRGRGGRDRLGRVDSGGDPLLEPDDLGVDLQRKISPGRPETANTCSATPTGRSRSTPSASTSPSGPVSRTAAGGSCSTEGTPDPRRSRERARAGRVGLALGSEEGQLVSGPLRAAEGVGPRVVRPARLEADLAGLGGEQRGDGIGILALSALPKAPGRVVHLPAAGLLDPVQHLLRPQRQGLAEALLEDRPDRPRQPQQDVAGEVGAGARGLGEHPGDALVEPGDDRRDAHADPDPGTGEPLDDLEPPPGSGDARLDGAGEVLVAEGKADRDAEAGIAGELLEDVDVALDDR